MALDPATLSLAFAAGAASFFSPCAVGLLPAYLGFYLGVDDKVAGDWRLNVAKGILYGGTAAGAFLVVFGLAGLAVATVSTLFVPVLPWVSLAIGVAIIALGALMLSGRSFGPAFKVRAPRSKGFGSLFLFGAAYSLVSMGCTFPLFLAVVLGALQEASFAGALLTLVVYALGMGLLMIAVTVALSVAGTGLRARLTSWSPKVQAAAAIVMVAAGLWLIYYWLDFLYDLPGNPSI